MTKNFLIFVKANKNTTFFVPLQPKKVGRSAAPTVPEFVEGPAVRKVRTGQGAWLWKAQKGAIFSVRNRE